MHPQIKYCFIIISLFLINASNLTGQSNINLIPQPTLINEKEGKFTVKDNLTWYAESDSLADAMTLFFDQVKLTTGVHITKTNDLQKADILLFLNTTLPVSAYALDINQEKIRIQAGHPDGVFYASQTLLQLFPGNIYRNTRSLKLPLDLPCVLIEDKPRFPYRGMHLDVCRHFFPKEFIKKYIDYIAMHKMNYFHWHLTDDQGWRIEIKKYPLLTKVGSVRKETLIGSYNDMPHKFDNTEYGGFYTQEDIKEIVAYAAKRFVTIIPEIEMPGHSLAALSAYPELSCNGGTFTPATIWGVFDDVFCPKDATFTFLEDVLSEVMGLFPGNYIHVGGDECPKERWKTCARCQVLMKQEGLKSEEELQSYFIHRIEKFINSKGRKLIGWDEILEGGLAPNATVMSWRGTSGGIEAAKQNHDVVMTPGSHCYFDHYQSLSLNEPVAIGGFTPVMKVYSYEPVPEELNEEQAKHILGAQGNVWTEYIGTPDHVEYMALPRMCALAEVDWSAKGTRNEADFKKRLAAHLLRLKAMNCHFASHIFDPEISTTANAAGNLLINLTPSQPTDKITYSIDNPLANSSNTYSAPVEMKSSGLFSYQSQGDIKGNELSITFQKSLSFNKSITLKDQPSDRYPGAKGAATLVDGLRGGKRFNGQNWCGFLGKNLEAVIDLGSITKVKEVSVGTIENTGAWIKAPKSLTIWVSNTGDNYEKVYEANAVIGEDNLVKAKLKPINTRFVKLVLESGGIIDAGNPGAGKASWLFVDEILIR
ncbi:MAG TPA: family 20 glycosylhydrolase [Saprospiraceae bacterium]|nr:family 20 glycosylhydrolase [Saprospiraceae bacterium]